MTLQNAIGLGSIGQDTSGDILLNANAKVVGRFSANGFIETYDSYTHSFFKSWSEAGRFSTRLDLYGDNATSELEISLLRESTTSNAKAGLAVYRPNQTNTINAFIAGTGNTYFCANNGFLGIANTNPQDRLHVSSGFIRCSTGLKLGSNVNQLIYANAAPTSGTYLRGDIIINQSPSAGGFIGWVCVLGGSPGTWKTWGMISM